MGHLMPFHSTKHSKISFKWIFSKKVFNGFHWNISHYTLSMLYLNIYFYIRWLPIQNSETHPLWVKNIKNEKYIFMFGRRRCAMARDRKEIEESFWRPRSINKFTEQLCVGDFCLRERRKWIKLEAIFGKGPEFLTAVHCKIQIS